ncbi:hypothetical protein PoB_004009000 [Plakobranchus ocellatus]|uniref:Uncharacterized protein n=1 Tax=Plakobranchus ocellatus TaxID=259542 RepID=A0AAV4AYZ2_9GAST|nr:hypothetical protein PoB_004009000 [Plakobranchus ocellatus]
MWMHGCPGDDFSDRWTWPARRSGISEVAKTKRACHAVLTGWMTGVHNKVISGFKALRQAGAPMAGSNPPLKGSLQISGRTHKPLYHRRHRTARDRP